MQEQSSYHGHCPSNFHVGSRKVIVEILPTSIRIIEPLNKWDTVPKGFNRETNTPTDFHHVRQYNIIHEITGLEHQLNPRTLIWSEPVERLVDDQPVDIAPSKADLDVIFTEAPEVPLPAYLSNPDLKPSDIHAAVTKSSKAKKKEQV